MCLAAGMDSYCSKPVDAKQLLAVIDSFLKTSAGSQPSETVPAKPLAKPQAAGEHPPIAVDALLDRCMNNLATITIVLTKFEEQTQRDIAQLSKSIEADDSASVARTAHSLKGAAAIVAANQLSQVAAELERLGRAQQLDQLDEQLARLQAETRKCVEYLPQVRAIAAEKLGGQE